MHRKRFTGKNHQNSILLSMKIRFLSLASVGLKSFEVPRVHAWNEVHSFLGLVRQCSPPTMSVLYSPPLIFCLVNLKVNILKSHHSATAQQYFSLINIVSQGEPSKNC